MIKRVFLIVVSSYFLLTTIAYAEENVDEEEQKINMFKQMEAVTNIPWYYYAAMNQY
ncbi:hypothetical protein [Gracilibacillus oryzae]|uniref:hypothetical protein n=1 Tax=Gracilibacillus oryzae TaxID=1672701 RepID=UPI002B1BCFED|nr:hypothetical protein [Gracilibacillus oryzae]